MKTLIILLLLVLLAGGAFVSRPTQASFRAVVREQIAKQGATTGISLLDGAIVDAKTDLFMKTVTYKDRFLWVSVERDGKTIANGACAKWFPSGSDMAAMADQVIREKTTDAVGRLGGATGR